MEAKERRICFSKSEKTRRATTKANADSEKGGQNRGYERRVWPSLVHPEKKWLIANLDGQLDLGASASHCGLEKPLTITAPDMLYMSTADNVVQF